MRDYSPKRLAVIGFGASMVASLQLPVFGYVLSQFLFVLIENDQNTFQHQRNMWTLVFVLLCIGIGISVYIQKLAFALGGENLTCTLRV